MKVRCNEDINVNVCRAAVSYNALRNPLYNCFLICLTSAARNNTLCSFHIPHHKKAPDEFTFACSEAKRYIDAANDCQHKRR